MEIYVTSYEEFKEAVKSEILKFLPVEYANAEVEIKDISKENMTLSGLIIRKPETNICPTIYLSDYYRDYENGKDMFEIMQEISNTQIKYNIDTNFDTEKLTNFENIKTKIIPRILNSERNSEIKNTHPYTQINPELICVYTISLGEINGENVVVKINNGIFENYGISVDELHEIAKQNLSDTLFMTMKDFLFGLPPDLSKEIDFSNDDKRMYILTNKVKTYGASSILDDNIMDKVTSELGDIYILPSSIHELIFLKKTQDINIEDLKSLVREVNSNHVVPQDFLSDEVFIYDKETHELKIAA